MPIQVKPEDKKTIAVIGSLPDSFIVFRRDLVRTLAASGHRVLACASTKDPLYRKNSKDPVADILSFGCEFVDIPTERVSMNPVGDLKALAWMTRYLKGVRPQVVLTYTQKQLIFSTMAAVRAKVPTVVPMVTGRGYGLRDYESHTKQAAIIRMLYRMAFKKVRTIIFQNPDDLQLFRDLSIVKPYHRPVIVNGSGVDIKHFTPVPFPEGRVTFVMIARLMRSKGAYEYIEAARILKERGRDARVILVGPFDDHPHALKKEEVTDSVQAGIIEYPGPATDVRVWIGQSHVLVLPSYHEGTPVTVLEGMAMGRPVIVTDAPGCRETVEVGRNGYMVPVKDVAALADTMERFIDEPGLIAPFGKRSREIAEEKYASAKVTAQIAKALGVEIVSLSDAIEA